MNKIIEFPEFLTEIQLQKKYAEAVHLNKVLTNFAIVVGFVSVIGIIVFVSRTKREESKN